MPRGIELTIQVISQSKNQAASGLLESAFHSTSDMMRKLAAKLLVTRRSGQGLEAIIREFNPDDPYLVDLVKENRDKLIPGLRGAIVDSDVSLARQAFRLAYTQGFYEVLPTLMVFCLGPGSQDRTGIMLTTELLKFLDKYAAALGKNEPTEHHMLYETVLPELARNLVTKIKEYRFKPNEMTLAVFLRLYPFFSEAEGDLKRALRLTSSPVYVAAYRHLLSGTEEYQFNFITRCLARLNPPPIVPSIISERIDGEFWEAVLESIKPPLLLELKSNLSRLTPPAWIGHIDSFIGQLDADAQQGLVFFLQNILKGENLQSNLIHVFQHGGESARAAALTALSAFTGAEIDRLVWDASADPAPAVQAEALAKMSERELPNAASRIIQFADSPHEKVRDTVQKLLPGFRFGRLMLMFDQLDEERRRKMFNVIRQIDKNAPKEMVKLLKIGDAVEKAKVLKCAEYAMEVVPQIEEALCEILTHEEAALLRQKAAELLTAGRRDVSRMVLVQALHRDTDPTVRDAAKKSLEQRPTYWSS